MNAERWLRRTAVGAALLGALFIALAGPAGGLADAAPLGSAHRVSAHFVSAPFVSVPFASAPFVSASLASACLVSAPLASVPLATVPAEVETPDAADPAPFLDTDLVLVQQQAIEAYQAKDYRRAIAFYLEAVSRNIRDATSLYNLACCYALTGDDANASRMLERAWRTGFRDLALLRRDADFDAIRTTPRFAAVVDSFTREAAQEAALGQVLLVEGTGHFACRVRLPAGYDSTRSYPLVVGLHGFGSNPEEFVRARLRLDRNDFVFAALRGPYDVGGNGYSWYIRDAGKEADAATTSASVEYIAGAITALQSRYRTDRTYLFGFSQGARMAYLAGIRHPELVRGLLCFGGWLETGPLPAGALEAGRAVRVFIGHGRKDPAIPFAEAESAEQTLRAAGYTVKLAAFEDGHTVKIPVLADGWKWIQE